MAKKLNSNFPAGRKYRFGLICLLTVILGLAMTIIFPTVVALYEAFTYAVIGIYVVFAGGNVGSHIAAAKKVDTNATKG